MMQQAEQEEMKGLGKNTRLARRVCEGLPIYQSTIITIQVTNNISNDAIFEMRSAV